MRGIFDDSDRSSYSEMSRSRLGNLTMIAVVRLIIASKEKQLFKKILRTDRISKPTDIPA